MAEYADFELSLHRREDSIYAVDVRVSQPGSETDIRLGQDPPISIQLDFEELQSQKLDVVAYGSSLTRSLFANPILASAFAKARVAADSVKATLRVRLVFGADVQELNALYWETLRDPQDLNSWLFSGEKICLARYLSSHDWRTVTLRPQGELKALVAIANPSDLNEYGLASLNVSEELQRAHSALGNIKTRALPADGKGYCTIDTLMKSLYDGYDILYLIAHGTFRKSAWLLLEDEQGKVKRVSGEELVSRIRKIAQPPRLVVLASCESAGDGSGDALQALGPRLAEAGIPAVVAMQGKVTVETITRFMPVFFQKLQEDGQIDRAFGIAREAIISRPDFWMPVLFLQLKSGRIWYRPGTGNQDKFTKWPSLLTNINEGNCTPILGAGLYEPLLGTWREMATELAERYSYPLAYFHRDALPQVAQYVAIYQDSHTLLSEVTDTMRKNIRSRFDAQLSENSRYAQANAAQLLTEAGRQLRMKDEFEQHRVLADLGLPIYITTNYDNLMVDALEEAGRKPQVVICPWNNRFAARSVYDSDPDYRPSRERPLVYHLFGHLSQPDSLVLTEDDYFEFLIGVTRNKDLIPNIIWRTLSNTALMFIGFQLDDWAFRVLYLTVMGLEGRGLGRRRYSHIAVQMHLDEHRNINPQRARSYLEEYFKGASVNIYWGQSADFLRELGQYWRK